MRTILILLALSNVAQAQTWLDLAGAAALQYTSGYHRGRADAAWFHYDRVAVVSPWYDNPKVSWRNKYKGGDPANGPAFWGSTGGLVWLTDDWHFDNMVRNQVGNLAATWMVWGADKTASKRRDGWWVDITGIPRQDKPWWAYLAEQGVLFAANSAGFHTSYNLVYR